MVFILRRYSATERREPGRSGYNIVGLSLHSLHVAAAAAAAAISGGWLHWRRGCKSSSRQQSRRPPISSTAGRTRAQPARPGGSTSLLSAAAASVAATATATCLGTRFLSHPPLSPRTGVARGGRSSCLESPIERRAARRRFRRCRCRCSPYFQVILSSRAVLTLAKKSPLYNERTNQPEPTDQVVAAAVESRVERERERDEGRF